MKAAVWLKAHKVRHAVPGRACPMIGRGRIGTGMGAKPDVRSEMPAAGIAPSRSGAGAPWMPSPMAATLPAAHRVDVRVDVARASGRGRRSPCRISACRRLRRSPKTPFCGRRRRVGSTTAPRASAAMWRAGDRLLQGARHRRRAPDEEPRRLPDPFAVPRRPARPRGEDRSGGGGRPARGWRPRSTAGTPPIPAIGRWPPTSTGRPCFRRGARRSSARGGPRAMPNRSGTPAGCRPRRPGPEPRPVQSAASFRCGAVLRP